MPPSASAGVVVQALEPPVGSTDVVTSPLLSTATHNETDGQDTPERSAPVNRVGNALRVLNGPATAAECHVPAPPLGSVELMTLPARSTATQSVSVGHETAEMLRA
jgi:hypothetical protein